MTRAGPAAAKSISNDVPLAALNPAAPEIFQTDTLWPVFARLRREDPVHYTLDDVRGPFWSITKYDDIVAIDADHQRFSSADGIVLGGKLGDAGPQPMFIAMDPPKHSAQRKAVSPALSPASLERLEPLIRERAGTVLDGLPIGEPFDWVDRVSVELTAMTLATLFGIPQEDRRRLTRWSDVVVARPGHGIVDTKEAKRAELMAFADYFTRVWNDRVNSEPGGDLISMLAHNPATRSMALAEYFGNVILLTIGGNDTTRNSLTGSLYGLNTHRAQYAMLRADPGLIPSMVSEAIRWQTPLAHMKRVAREDVAFGGKIIRKGDRVVMWYVSGNRDEAVIENPDAFIIDRARPRAHLSFGFGIHRCVGSRLAELQLRVIWEEILARFDEVNVVEEPRRTYSNFIRGYERMMVEIRGRRR